MTHRLAPSRPGPTLERKDRRRRRARRDVRADARGGLLVIGAVVVVVALGAWGSRAWVQGRRGAAESAAQSGAVAMGASTPDFARLRGAKLMLALPAAPPELIAVGFHQAQNPRARQLVPVLPWLSTDDNTEAARRVRAARGKGIVMFTMNSRGRGTAKTTAADVVVKPDTLVVSPVTGKVTLVKRYKLYGRYDDLHVEIRPDGMDDVRVAMIHVRDIIVREGDRVSAGRTVIAKPRQFGFDAQIDRYVSGHWEHVHIQVNPYPPEKY